MLKLINAFLVSNCLQMTMSNEEEQQPTEFIIEIFFEIIVKIFVLMEVVHKFIAVHVALSKSFSSIESVN